MVLFSVLHDDLILLFTFENSAGKPKFPEVYVIKIALIYYDSKVFEIADFDFPIKKSNILLKADALVCTVLYFSFIFCPSG